MADPWATEALAAVSESERELVALLYGFDGPRHAAEEIAHERGLSLLRVENAARKAIRQLRHPARAGLVREALAAADERIWSALAGPTGIVHKSDSLPKAAARLPGDLLLAIESQYGVLESWLNANARVTEKAWYRSLFAEE